MNELILATSNSGKIKELRELLKPIECMPQAYLNIHDTLENGLSFVENALIKARHASALAKKPALADDSGLVVPALNGEPGIYSARYAREHATDAENIRLVLEKMQPLPEGQRGAFFYCAIVLVQHAKDPTPLIATGACYGAIHSIPLGNQGFGYDPIFFLPEYQCTMAQLPAKIKNNISHRAHALKHLRDLIQNLT